MSKLDAYLSTLSPMAAGKARKALERQQGFNGTYMTRAAYAEQLAANPHFRLDLAKARVYTSDDGRFFDLASVTQTLVDYALWLQVLPPVVAPFPFPGKRFSPHSA